MHGACPLDSRKKPDRVGADEPLDQADVTRGASAVHLVDVTLAIAALAPRTPLRETQLVLLKHQRRTPHVSQANQKKTNKKNNTVDFLTIDIVLYHTEVWVMGISQKRLKRF